jgi:hypothetical protein
MNKLARGLLYTGEEVHILILLRSRFRNNIGAAKKWAMNHSYKVDDCEVTEHEIRLRQYPASDRGLIVRRAKLLPGIDVLISTRKGVPAKDLD